MILILLEQNRNLKLSIPLSGHRERELLAETRRLWWESWRSEIHIWLLRVQLWLARFLAFIGILYGWSPEQRLYIGLVGILAVLWQLWVVGHV